MSRCFAIVVSAFLCAVAASAAGEKLIWDDLKPGPMPVGFQVHVERDLSRVERPPRTLEGSLQRAAITRRLEITMWYPARSAPSSKRMRFRDYLAYVDDLFDARSEDRRLITDAKAREQMGLHSLATFAMFRDTPESAWAPILDVPMLAVRDAPAASGPFPIILHAPGANGTSTLNADSAEYLASHGYVVLSTPSRGVDALNDRLAGGAFYESQARDLEYLIAFAGRLKFADVDRMGALGFSRGGAAIVLLAARNPTIDAIVSWDSASFESRRDTERLRESPFFDPDRVTIPLMHIRAGNPGTPPALFESLRFAPRYVVNVDGAFHLDFTIIAMIHSTFGISNQYIKLPPEKTRAAHASINVITREFLDSFVGRTVDRQGLLPPLQPAAMFSITRTDALPPPPSSALLVERILSTNGVVSAREHIMRARQASALWTPFPESVLNGISDRMIELGRREEAVQVMMLNAELYPQSAGVWARLGAAQERTGQVDAAAQSFRKALELDPKYEPAAAALKRLGKD